MGVHKDLDVAPSLYVCIKPFEPEVGSVGRFAGLVRPQWASGRDCRSFQFVKTGIPLLNLTECEIRSVLFGPRGRVKSGTLITRQADR